MKVQHLDANEPQTADPSTPPVLSSVEGFSTKMVPAGGVMAGVQRYHLTLGPFPLAASEVRFTFRCTHAGCDCQDICCDPREYTVRVE